MGSMVDYTSLLNLHGNDPDGAHLQSHLDVDNNHPVHPDQIQLHHPGDNILEEAQHLVQQHNRGQVHMLQHGMAEVSCKPMRMCALGGKWSWWMSQGDGAMAESIVNHMQSLVFALQDATLHQGYVGQVAIQKTCSKCKETKVATEFFKDKSKPDGMYSQVCALFSCGDDQSRSQDVPYTYRTLPSLYFDCIHLMRACCLQKQI